MKKKGDSIVSQAEVPQESHVQRLWERYNSVRRFSLRLSQGLTPEDCAIQSMPDVSPTRWHLAHTTWFFETFVLATRERFKAFHPQFEFLFNSYYNTVGAQFPRSRRGLLSRPSLDEILQYRQHVDDQMQDLFQSEADALLALMDVVEIGLQHEQQHQELMLTDIKHVFAQNPLYPVFRSGELVSPASNSTKSWSEFAEGLYWIGHDLDGFAYDNETPAHRVFVESFELSDSLVTCREYQEFMDDGGYSRPEFWLSEGWQTICEQGWRAPLYWIKNGQGWSQFTLSGLTPLDLSQPICHVSYYEADAFATWCDARLPTEVEWEVASAGSPRNGNFVDTLIDAGNAIHPSSATIASDHDVRQMMGNVWEWTSSPYVAYPGYKPAEGALGEYNGKFMCNQYVLRGGSCASTSNHIRRTYRNFFPSNARWQFSGIRICR